MIHILIALPVSGRTQTTITKPDSIRGVNTRSILASRGIFTVVWDTQLHCIYSPILFRLMGARIYHNHWIIYMSSGFRNCSPHEQPGEHISLSQLAKMGLLRSTDSRHIHVHNACYELLLCSTVHPADATFLVLRIPCYSHVVRWRCIRRPTFANWIENLLSYIHELVHRSSH